MTLDSILLAYIVSVFAKIRATRAFVDALRQHVVIDGEFDHLDDLVELRVRVEVIARQVNKIGLVHVVVGEFAVTQQGLILTVVIIIAAANSTTEKTLIELIILRTFRMILMLLLLFGRRHV